MAKRTQPRAHGAFSGRRYSAFSGKGGDAHPVDALTQPRAYGAFTGRRYGSFAGRDQASTHPVGRITQLRAFGAFTGRRYGSFAGRTQTAPPEPFPVFRGGGIRIPVRPRIIDDADELMTMISAALIAINQQ